MKTQEDCKHEPGVMMPVIDRNSCEGKADCVAVCPVSVFAIQTLPQGQRAELSLRGKMKGFMHSWRQAVLVNPEACEGCGLCIRSCPESAITLEKAAG